LHEISHWQHWLSWNYLERRATSRAMRQAPCSGRPTPESADRAIARPLALPAMGSPGRRALMPGLPAQSVIHFAIGRRKVMITDRN
jgi:hypothetical protein